MATNANEILDRLAALLDAATPGPWELEGRGGIRMDGTRDAYMVMHGPLRVCQSGHGPGNGREQQRDDLATLVALRNAAPALIRLARASIATTKGEPISMPEWAAVCHEHSEAIKALGEVRL